MGDYRIRRFYRDGCINDSGEVAQSEVIEEGLTLEEAKAHCKSDESHGEGWFDGFESM